MNGSTGSGSAGSFAILTKGGASVILEGIEINGTYYKGVDGNGNEYYIKSEVERSDAFGNVMSTTSETGVTPPQDATNDNMVVVPDGWTNAKATEWASFMLDNGVPYVVVANYTPYLG